MAAPASGGKVVPWEAQLAMAGVPAAQQVGYVVAPAEGGGEVVHEVIATPIVASDTGEVIGAIVLGFEAGDFGVTNSADGIKSGIWLNGRLHLPRTAQTAIESLDEKILATLIVGETADGSAAVDVNGPPHLLFARELNAASRFPTASQVCLYPPAGSLARQRSCAEDHPAGAIRRSAAWREPLYRQPAVRRRASTAEIGGAHRAPRTPRPRWNSPSSGIAALRERGRRNSP